MGIADAFARVLAYTTRREPPSYAPPSNPTADSNMHDTNGDASVAWLRAFVASGPARPAPVRGDTAGETPQPSGTVRGTAPSPGSYGAYKIANGGTVNVSGDAPSVAKALPYGVIDGGDR